MNHVGVVLVGGRCRRGHQSQLLLELVTVGIPSDFGRLRDLDPRYGVNAPALAPLAVGGHVALEVEKKKHKLDKLDNKNRKKEKRGRGGGVEDAQWERSRGGLMKHGIRRSVGVRGSSGCSGPLDKNEGHGSGGTTFAQ